MKFLLIDTTTSFVTVSIIYSDKVLYYFHDCIKDDMASKLVPILEEAFNSVDFKLKDIDKILVSNGPGSFTGIRVGVTIAKTIAWALNISIVPISSLELLATTKVNKKYIVPMIDARRGNVFAGIYDTDLNQIKKDRLINFNELIEELDEDYEFVSYDNINNSIKPNIDVLKIVNKYRNDDGVDPHKLNPNYLKLTEAEESRQKDD